MASPGDILLLVCILMLCLYIFNLLSRKANRLPPGPVGFPVVGSLLALGSSPNESLARLSKLHGPLMTLHLGYKTTVVVSSAEMAEEVLFRHDHAFAGRTVLDVVTAFDYNRHSLVLAQIGPRWREMRRICNTELFTPKRLDALRGLRESKVRALLQHVRAASVGGRPVDIGDCAFATTLNLTANTLFSQDLVDLESEEADGFKSLIWKMLELNTTPNLADYFPVLRRFDLQGLRRQNEVLLKQLYAVFDELIDRRLEMYDAAAEGEGKRKDDFLDVLLELTRDRSSGFTRDNIKPLLTDLFIAGSETSSTTIEWATTELLRHPDKMAAAQSELKRTIGTDRLVEESDIPHLPYLEAVLKETLRLHPPVPLLVPHRADETTKVAGFTIPKHTQVLVNVWAIGRDPAYWANAMSFLPERFLESDVNFKGKDFQFIPFGAGRRICPGMPLAIRMALLVLASLIHTFSWALPSGIAPEQIDMEAKFSLTLRKAMTLKAFPSPLIEADQLDQVDNK